MTYRIIVRGKMTKVENVVKVTETFTDWVFTKADGTTESYSKFTTDIL